MTYNGEEKDMDGEMPADPHGLASTLSLFRKPKMTRTDLDPAITEPAQATVTAGLCGLTRQATLGAMPCLLARRAFAGLPDQIRAARSWLARLTDDVPGGGDAVLACSELATNAIMHSNSGLPGGTFTVRANIDHDVIRIEVIDQGGPWSRLCGQHDDITGHADQSGRGLAIIAAIASAWGISGDQEGRIAWCEIRAG